MHTFLIVWFTYAMFSMVQHVFRSRMDQLPSFKCCA